ncbi:hypothetical protein JYK04_00219 [Streptomyces nojiriensis]|nr:hypothetical protein JYK04_00219 [Streptomyces nojiriensis]
MAAVVAFGSWVLWPVYDSSCVVYSGSYVPMNAPKAEVDAAMQWRYDKAVADGACGPKRARFHNWTRSGRSWPHRAWPSSSTSIRAGGCTTRHCWRRSLKVVAEVRAVADVA